MNLEEMQRLQANARKELYVHGLDGWRFAWNNAKNTYGLCNYRKQTIFVSRPLARVNSYADMWDTVIHEVAHALTPGHGHNDIWKLVCKQLGAKPERCKDANLAPPKWYGRALGCPHTFFRNRLTKLVREESYCAEGACKGWDRRVKWFHNDDQATEKMIEEFFAGHTGWHVLV